MKVSTKAMIRGLFVIGLITLSVSTTSRMVQAQKKQAPTAKPKVVECVKNSDVACISEFLATGGKATAVDQKGSTLLSIASETKSTTMVRLLLNAGADPNDAGSAEPPLCRAALFGRKQMAEALVDWGAKPDVNCDEDHGDSALMAAIRGAMFADMPLAIRETLVDPDEIRESADNEQDGNEKVAQAREMLAVSVDDYLELARMLIARGADVNVVAKCEVGESALMYASMAANVDMVKTLLQHGAEVSTESPILDMLRELEMEYRRIKFTALPALSRQQTALLDWLEKTKAGRQEITQLLKAAGASESASNQEDFEYSQERLEDEARQAFNDVIESGDLKDFERLLAAYINHPLGAAVLPDALRFAVIDSEGGMVKLLLERGVNPNGTDKHTPLMQAAGSGNLEIVKLLIAAGADPNAEDPNGRTALDEAERYTQASDGYQPVVAFLKARGARNGIKRN